MQRIQWAKRKTVVLLLIGGVALAIVGTCGVMVSRWKPGDPKGPTPIDWDSTRLPSDAQLVDLARQVMTRHGRDLTNLKLESMTHQDDGSILILFRNQQNAWLWFVELRHENGKWVGETRHGT